MKKPKKVKRIICVGGSKGGTGKTTLSLELAHELSRLGLTVQLMDLDPQNSCVKVANLRESRMPFSVGNWAQCQERRLPEEIKSQADKNDAVILDCGGYDSASSRLAAICATDYVMVLEPSTLSLLEAEKLKSTLGEVLALNPNLRYRTLVNRVPVTSRKDAGEAISCLVDWALNPLTAYICQRKAISDATSRCQSVTEFIPAKKRVPDAASAKEIRHAVTEILGEA